MPGVLRERCVGAARVGAARVGTARAGTARVGTAKVLQVGADRDVVWIR